MPDMRLDSLITYARRFVGAPYVWGGNGPHQFDCSGLANTILKKSGNIRVSEDLTAQQIHARLSENGTSFELNAEGKLQVQRTGRFSFPVGSWFFYGKGADAITHIAFLVDPYSVLEAGGGDQTTTTPEKARAIGAWVREVSVTHRKDLVSVIFPKYGWTP